MSARIVTFARSHRGSLTAVACVPSRSPPPAGTAKLDRAFGTGDDGPATPSFSYFEPVPSTPFEVFDLSLESRG